VGFYPDRVRLVSLLPSATEIVYALGLGDELVGVTFECDEPPAARQDKAIVVGAGTPAG
jgi:iron complex transport system substrate-binding protein